MFWWYFIIGCDGKICPPCRKWYTNCGGLCQVGQNLINPSSKKLKTGQSPVIHPFEKLVDTGDPWLHMITAMFKCRNVAKWVLWWFLMCFQFWRLLGRALCFDDISSLDVMVRSVLLVGSGTPTVVACARLVKIWLTHQAKNWKQARVQSFILLKNWWTLGIHGCIW